MSDPLERRLKEDRALRNAALELVKADVAHVRSELARKGLGSRLVGRMSDGAIDVFEEAVSVAENNRGTLATLIAAVGVWFMRNPIMDLFTEDEPEPSDAAGPTDPEI